MWLALGGAFVLWLVWWNRVRMNRDGGQERAIRAGDEMCEMWVTLGGAFVLWLVGWNQLGMNRAEASQGECVGEEGMQTK